MGALRPGLRPRGSSLIAVLMLITLLLILGIGLMSQKTSQYDASARRLEAAQARQLAQAGLVDCQLKLAKDRTFPPLSGKANESFTYTEDVNDLDGKPVGSYSVTLDFALNQPPHSICQVRSQGWLGDRSAPRSTYLVYLEVDMSRTLRNDSSKPNPNFRRPSHYLEEDTPKPP